MMKWLCMWLKRFKVVPLDELSFWKCVLPHQCHFFAPLVIKKLQSQLYVLKIIWLQEHHENNGGFTTRHTITFSNCNNHSQLNVEIWHKLCQISCSSCNRHDVAYMAIHVIIYDKWNICNFNGKFINLHSSNMDKNSLTNMELPFN
jgi:hypothetical protein